jgi:uncharacterized protein (DUF427 family)
VSMKAIWQGRVIAEAPKEDLIYIEGHWYFPPSSVQKENLNKSPTPYHCFWKGECQYFDVKAGSQVCSDCAFSYPNPIPASIDTVGKDYANYVAFWKEVVIEE